MNSGDALFDNTELVQDQVNIKIYSDRVEIINPCGLPKGLTPKAFGNISIRRNEIIADLFYRLHKVERIGMGIKNMKNLMRSMSHKEPQFEMNGFFKVVFNRPYTNISKVTEDKGKTSVITSVKILDLMKKEPEISAKRISEILDISLKAVEMQIFNLHLLCKIKRVGTDKGGHWEVLE